MELIMAHEGEHTFILSLSGRMVAATSSKVELRKAYLLVSAKVHPDKNPGCLEATKAFQVLVEAFERLANPEKFEEEEEEEGPAKKRQKKERFVRGNQGCHVTRIRCPRCRDTWNTSDLVSYTLWPFWPFYGIFVVANLAMPRAWRTPPTTS